MCKINLLFMIEIKKITLAIILALTTYISFSQKLNNTLYHMRDLPQSNIVNPAFQIDAKIYIGLPLINSNYINYSNSSFNFSDVITDGVGAKSDSLVYNVNGFLDAIKTRNFVSAQVETSLLALGYKHKEYYFSLGLTDKLDARASFSRNLVDYLYQGNYPFRGQDVNLGAINLDAIYYRELAIGASKIVNEKITLGVKAKILFGMANIYTNKSILSAYTAKNGSELKFYSKQDIYTSLPIKQIIYESNGAVKDLKFSSNDFQSDFFLNRQNLGFAVDLGGIYKVDENTTLSASILDLGFISWKSDVRRFSQDSTYTFKGDDWSQSINSKAPDYKPIDKIMDSLLDSLDKGFKVNTYEGKYTKAITAKVYLAANYTISKKTNLAVVSRTEIFRGKLFPSLSFSANTSLSRYLSASMSYSIVNKDFLNLGFGFASKLGPVQIYALSDNILAAIKPNTSQTANIRVGINLLFGNANDKENKTSCNLYPQEKKKKIKKSKFLFFKQNVKNNKRKIKKIRSPRFFNKNKKAKNKIKKRHRW